MGCGCNQTTTCNSCAQNTSCGCSGTTSCTDCCNNTCPCTDQPCGCEVELDAACIRYTGEDLSCIDVVKGDTLESALKTIAEKYCNFSGSYVTVVNETAGVNCVGGGVLISVFDSESDALLEAVYLCNGEQGQSIDHTSFTSSSLGGAAGQQGATDTYTVWGDLAETISLGTFTVYNGVDGDDGIGSVLDTPTIDLTYTAGTLQADITDTGWIPLLGFTYMTGSTVKPQCRRIGNVIYFKGTCFIPMGDTLEGAGGTATLYTNSGDYNSLAKGFTLNTVESVDADALLLKTTGLVNWTVGQEAISADFNRGASVIPPGILNGGEVLDDGSTVTGKIIIERVARSVSSKDVTMNSVCTLSFYSTGVLRVGSANFNDKFSATPVGKTALTRQLCTQAISGDNIPEYLSTAPSQFNASAAGLYSPSINGTVEIYAFNQDSTRAEQLGGFAINFSDLKLFIA